MTWEGICFVLMGLIIVQFIINQFMVNKLINKLMSRNYHEYRAAEHLHSEGSGDRIVKESTSDLDVPEDLGILQGLG